MKKLWVALGLYAALGLLIWTTMSDSPVPIAGGSISIRAVPLAIVAFFAVKTVLRWKAEQIQAEDEES
jgi:hypothetical protein